MQELSLNILDIAQNSVAAEATLTEIDIFYIHSDGGRRLTVAIRDNGKGMSEETAKNASDPFYTTRTTRKVGLGTAFFKMAAEMADGSYQMKSRQGVGTMTSIELCPDHIDAVPMGDIAATFVALVQTEPSLDFVLTMGITDETGSREFRADTRSFRQVLEGIPLSEPAVLTFIKEYIDENIAEIFPAEYSF